MPGADRRGVRRQGGRRVGGQGGGVLTNWVVDLAERNGYVVQATSVPGVAQRTGATIYYVVTGWRRRKDESPAGSFSLRHLVSPKQRIRHDH